MEYSSPKMLDSLGFMLWQPMSYELLLAALSLLSIWIDSISLYNPLVGVPDVTWSQLFDEDCDVPRGRFLDAIFDGDSLRLIPVADNEDVDDAIDSNGRNITEDARIEFRNTVFLICAFMGTVFPL